MTKVAYLPRPIKISYQVFRNLPSHVLILSSMIFDILFGTKPKASFPFVTPPSSLMGAYLLHPQTHVPYFYMMIYYVMPRAL